MAKLINILLRKTDPDFPWGFTLGAVPPALHSVQITSVDDGSLASEHLEPGDRVLEIEGIDTTMLSNSEVETLLTNPSNKLELLIMKRAKPGHKLFSEPNIGTTRTFKTKETVSSTSEEKEETKILNKNLIEESKTVTTEGEIHKQVTETNESTENQRTDTFWTCAPSDLVRTDKRKSAEADHRGTSSRNLSHSNYISESSIFKNLNNYRDEERKLDPREEKRRFWESCRKGDHVRRFKWGDSVKPNGVSPTGRSDGSTESLFCKSPSNPVSIPKMERSKSCEPSDCQSTFNPFFQFKNNTSVSPTNPFYREFERANSSQTNEIFSSSLDEKKLKSLQKPVAQKHDVSLFTRESIQNNLSSSCFYDNQSTKCYKDIAEHIQSENHRTVEHFAHEVKKAEGKTSSDDVNMCSGNWSPQADSTNVVSKNEFETKRKFFENVCSVPTASVNTSAREIVEEKLLDRGTSSPTTPTPLWTEPKNTYQKESNLEAHSYHTLKKPSDFINQKMGTGDALHNQIKPEISEKMKLVEDVENATYQNTMSTEEQISSQESTKFYVGHVSEDTTNYSKNQFAMEENQADFNSFQAIQDQKVLNSKNSSWGASDWNAESFVGSTSDEQSKETLKSKNHTTDSFASEECMSHRSYINDSFEAGWTSPYKTYALNEQMSTRRGGSLERDFYERKVFQESNYKRVSKGSQSPYENVVSASSKEYQEERRPCSDSEKRSRTPAEFYDNYEVPIKLVRAKSPIDISFKTFRDIQTRLGTLLGAKPISIENFKYHSERAGKDSVEEAFQKLAIQEGIVDSTNCDESISRQTNQIGGHSGSGSPGTNSVDGPPPPPPPLPGGIPSQKLSTNIPQTRRGYEPPAAIQNAMMTKDKKPFTYTPGGLDLAEIRSPRMAKRINRNAHLEDSCTPQQQRPQQSGPPPMLPPSAMAAMQPQIAIPVFPPGGGFPSQLTPPPPPPPPAVASSPVINNSAEPNFPPPPPLPNVAVKSPNSSPPSGAIPPPPPPPPPAATPTNCKSATPSPQEEASPQSNGFTRGQPLAFLQEIHNRPQLRSVGPINQNKLPSDFVAEIPNHAPLRNVQHPPRSSYDPKDNQTQIPIQLKSVGPKPSAVTSSAPPFIPQPMSPESQPNFHQSENEPNIQQTAQQHHPMSPPVAPTPLATAPIQNPPRPPTTPLTHAPSLNRAPAPWMTTRQLSRDVAPPWTSKQDVANEQQLQPPPLTQQSANGSAPTVTRVIPIQIEGQEIPKPQLPPQTQLPPQQNPYFAMQTPQMYVAPQQRQPFPHHQFATPPPPPYYQEQGATPLHQQPSSSQPFSPTMIPQVQSQGRTHIIPIRVEGMSDENQAQSPVAFAQRLNSSDAPDGTRRPLQSQTSWTGAPTQSRSFRVLQKITGSEDELAGPFPAPTSETFLVNRVLPQQQGRLDESEY